jgi:hypothetical protein
MVPSQARKPEPSVKTERRARPRFPIDRYVACQAHETRTGWLARIRDISQRGIALVLRHRFEPGTELTIELETNGWPRHLSVRVIYATRDTKDRWIIGCAFVSQLSEEELQGILHP